MAYIPTLEDLDALDNAPQAQPQPTQEEPSIANRAMASFLHQQSPLGPTKNYDPEANNLGLGEKIGIGVMDFLPYLTAGGLAKGAISKIPAVARYAASSPKLASLFGATAENAGTGAAYGAVNSNPGETLAGAGMGGALGALSGPLGAISSGLGSIAAKKYAQSAIPAFIEKATEKLRANNPEAITKTLAGKYGTTNLINKRNWQNTDEMATHLTKEMSEAGKSFNAKPYNDHIDNYLAKIEGMSPAQKVPYANAQSFAEYAKTLSPTNFNDVVDLRKNFNTFLRDHLEKGGIKNQDRLSNMFVGDLKNVLKNDVVDANKGNVSKQGLESFKDHWERANKSNQDLNNFYKSENQLGTLMNSTPLRKAYEGLKGGQALDPNIFNRYLPKLGVNAAKGTKGLEHLEDLLGSKEAAQNAAKATLFRRPAEQGYNTVDSGAIYSKLSPAQRNYIFGDSPEGQMLGAVNNTRNAFGREPARNFWEKGLHHGLGLGVPGLVGYEAGKASGQNNLEALGTGLAAGLGSHFGPGLIGRTANPNIVNKSIQRAQEGAKNKGRYLNILAQQNLNPNIMRGQ